MLWMCINILWFFIELPRNIKIWGFDTLTMSEKLLNLPVLNWEHSMSMLAHPEFTEVFSLCKKNHDIYFSGNPNTVLHCCPTTEPSLDMATRHHFRKWMAFLFLHREITQEKDVIDGQEASELNLQ